MEQKSRAESPNDPVAFAGRLATSESFKAMFREGMALVEETAAYLDGDGRVEARGLSRAGSLAYATESMRLTTRLMQLASWLLLQRAVNDGEMTNDQARNERSKVKIGGLGSATDGPGWTDIPERLQRLILRSLSLQERVRRLDEVLNRPPQGEAANPVARQLGAIADAFGAGR